MWQILRLNHVSKNTEYSYPSQIFRWEFYPMILLTHVLEFYVTIFNESLYPSQKDGNDESPPLGETLFSVDLSFFDGHDCLRYPWRWTEDNYFSSRLQIIWQSTITSSLTFDRFAVSQCIISLRVPSWPWNSVVSKFCEEHGNVDETNLRSIWRFVPNVAAEKLSENATDWRRIDTIESVAKLSIWCDITERF